ncbi:rano class II histocompatibility A beta chain-like protein [Labeo rohita]|uniref:Rano class II histocompatibility A beta chain-like protein n=2 Tax=Labeo rohita TaxID=84645 RepID=A0A498M1X1_LABRO|nr:rano class II histocompatibility A beta chain-like protein [Labeo rohita]
MKWADDFNKKPEWLHKEAEKIIAHCKRYGQLFLPEVEKTVKPEVIVRTVRQASGKIPAMLICSAYDFYPKPIKLTWMRDDKEMTADVTSTEELADGDWYYQIHSHLEYFPKPGEKISCVVEHASSNKPMIYDLGPSLSESDRNKLITGAAGLVLGLIMAVGGLIYCKRKHTVKPEVINRSIRQASSKIPAMLICSAYDFYPKPIKLTWMRDDKEMTADVTSTEELADGDWYYQIHSNLEYFPKPGEKISCVLEHASSNKAMIYDLGAAGVVLGVIMAAGGLIYYKRRHKANAISAGSQDSRHSEHLQALSGTEEL